jgi:trimethylamine--corrinoid protein Co-methyltransferase
MNQHEAGTVRRRRGTPPAQAPVGDRGLHHGATAPYQVLSTTDVQKLLDAAFTLMSECGVAFEVGSAALDILRKAGCRSADDGVVYFDRGLVQDCLASAAKTVKLWNRPGTACIDIDCRHTWFMPGMTCIKVYDLESGESRDSNGEDLAMITRVADALPNIDAVCIGCKNVARSDIHGEIDEFAIMAANTQKPLEYLCEHAASLDPVIELARVIRGGADQLMQKPYFLQIVTPLPMNYHAAHSDQIIKAVNAGVPVSVGTLPIGGASTPITPAGSIVNSLATDFAAMVLAQLVRRGSFCIGSSDVCFMEPATGSIGNFAQTALADMVMCQVRRELELPSFTGAAGYSSARRFNEDAVMELATTMMQLFYSRPATVDYCGSLDQGLTFSLHALLLCDDLVGLLRTLWQGVRIDADMLALDIAREVGPRGNYLSQVHTASHCREQLWSSRYFGASMPLSSDLRPDKDLGARIDISLREILSSHRPASLDTEVLARMRAVQERFAASYVAT